MASAGGEIFDATKHDHVVWLAGRRLRGRLPEVALALFAILTARGVRFGVLAKEKCTGNSQRTGNENLFQELATANVEDFLTRRA